MCHNRGQRKLINGEPETEFINGEPETEELNWESHLFEFVKRRYFVHFDMTFSNSTQVTDIDMIEAWSTRLGYMFWEIQAPVKYYA